MELIAPAVLCVAAGITAVAAALAPDPTRACLALGATVAAIAALALIHFDAPLAAAAILIAHGGLGVINARLARQACAVGGRVRHGWVLLVVVAFAGILFAAVVPASSLPVASTAPLTGPQASSIQAFLIAVVSLAAVAVTLGLNAVARRYAEAEHV
jgi:hypothetical protein